MSDWICESCGFFPPSSSDGKPCTFCDPDDPILNFSREAAAGEPEEE